MGEKIFYKRKCRNCLKFYVVDGDVRTSVHCPECRKIRDYARR